MIETYIYHHETCEIVIFYSDNPLHDLEEQLFICWEYEPTVEWQYMLKIFGNFDITWHGIKAGIVVQESNAFHIYPIG